MFLFTHQLIKRLAVIYGLLCMPWKTSSVVNDFIYSLLNRIKAWLTHTFWEKHAPVFMHLSLQHHKCKQHCSAFWDSLNPPSTHNQAILSQHPWNRQFFSHLALFNSFCAETTLEKTILNAVVFMGKPSKLNQNKKII